MPDKKKHLPVTNELAAHSAYRPPPQDGAYLFIYSLLPSLLPLRRVRLHEHHDWMDFEYPRGFLFLPSLLCVPLFSVLE